MTHTKTAEYCIAVAQNAFHGCSQPSVPFVSPRKQRCTASRVANPSRSPFEPLRLCKTNISVLCVRSTQIRDRAMGRILPTIPHLLSSPALAECHLCLLSARSTRVNQQETPAEARKLGDSCHTVYHACLVLSAAPYPKILNAH